tara:strand:+ start:156 stop:1082 length:927 start_codon:yes stop_codon:yes gene_type:complete
VNTILYLIASSFVNIIRLFPLKLIGLVGRQIGFVFYYIDGRHRRVAVNNLSNCLGNSRSQKEIIALAKENFRRLGEVYLSALKTAFIPPEKLSGILSVRGDNLIDRSKLDDGSDPSYMLAVGHFGNFEMYGKSGHFEPGYDLGTTYRGFKQPWVDKLIKSLRGKSGCTFFDRRFDGAKLKKFMARSKTITGLLADQSAGRSGILLPFFGHPCSTNAAPALFSLRYNLRLHGCYCRRLGLGRWELELSQEIPTKIAGQARPVEDIMTDVNALYERYILEDPANWFWVHDRWKRADRAKKRGTPKAASQN